MTKRVEMIDALSGSRVPPELQARLMAFRKEICDAGERSNVRPDILAALLCAMAGAWCAGTDPRYGDVPLRNCLYGFETNFNLTNKNLPNGAEPISIEATVGKGGQ